MITSFRKFKYSINENYFDKIDTHEKAYILGLFISDGNNMVTKHTVKIDLKADESEIELLNNICKEMDYNRQLTFYKSNKTFGKYNWVSNTVRFAIFNKKISNRLNDLGIVPNKTFICDIPNELNPKFYNSFILGIFDGDGSISENKVGKNKGLFNINIIGNKKFIEKINRIISIGCGINENKVLIEKRSGNGNIGQIFWCGNNVAIRMRVWLYKDCKLFLKRKKDIFDRCKSSKRNIGQFLGEKESDNDELRPMLRKFYEDIKICLDKKNENEFTSNEIANDYNLQKIYCRRLIKELISFGYIRISGGRANTGYKYKISK